jgi:hypothetical protein
MRSARSSPIGVIELRRNPAHVGKCGKQLEKDMISHLSDSRVSCSTTCNQYFFYLTARQVANLRMLKQEANHPIRDNQIVALTDIVYGALWRALSRFQFLPATNALMIVDPIGEPHAQQNIKSIRLSKKLISISSDKTILSKPLIEIARHIRRNLHRDTQASGLVESAEGGVLLCSTISLPTIQANAVNLIPDGAAHFRASCLNGLCACDGGISIDMRLPKEEMAFFKARFGGGHTVANCFFQ